MNSFAQAVARQWGRQVARYGRWNLQHAHVHAEGITDVPDGPVIWAGWHATNLIALSVYPRLQRGRTCTALVAPALAGETMRGWLTASGTFETITIDDTTSTKTAVKHLSRALVQGHDVVIAVDGPHGPAGVARPGALWLGRLTGCPVVPSGFAAHPAVRLPRWDRQLVPVPLAHLALVFGPAIRLDRHTPIEEPALARLTEALNGATQRAWTLLGKPLPGTDVVT